MEEKLQMTQKLMAIPSGQWFKLNDRPDKPLVVEVLNELIEQGRKFLLSLDGSKFMRASVDLFEWAETKPEGSEIKVIGTGRSKYYELYFNGKLIAIK